MLHVTAGLMEFLVMLIWAGLGAVAWVTAGLGLVLLTLGFITVGVRRAWKSHYRER